MTNNQIKVGRHGASRLAWIVALAVLVINVVWAVRSTSPVALVDGWAVLNRIMHFQRGDITLAEYLFRPHGAHLHFAAYAVSWLDFKYAGGAQTVNQWVSLAATALFGMFFVRMILREGARRQASGWVVVLGCAAAMAAICSLADAEIMLHPFQVVLSLSRLTFIVLLYAIIVGMIEERIGLYVVAMLLSLLAVTFHGTGYVFAICIVFAHVLVSRRIWMAVVSVAPLLSAVIVQNVFSQGSGELSNLGQALDLRSLVGIIPALAAYFASPLAILSVSIGTTALLCVGFVIFCAVTALTVRAILAILGVRGWNMSGLWQQLRAARSGPRAEPVQVFLAVIGVFLLASGVAATLFWVIRTATDVQQLPPSFYVLSSGRYGAFACLGFVIIIIAMLRSPRLRLDAPATLFKGGAVAVAASLLGMAMYSSLLELRLYNQDDYLNIAAAGIMTGLKPTQPEAQAVWENARDDPYWARELPATAEFMRAERKGLWHNMPPMGAAGGAFYAGYRIADVARFAVASDDVSGRCAFRGTVPVTAEFGKIGRVLPIANAAGVVVGYGALLRVKPAPNLRVVSGFARCPAGVTSQEPLFLGHDMHSSAALAMASEPAPPRGSGSSPIMPLSDMKGTLTCAIEPGVAGKGPNAVLTLTNNSNFDWTLDAGQMPLGIGVHLLDGKGGFVYWDDGLRVPASGAVIAPLGSTIMRLPVAAINVKGAGPERGTLTARFALVQDRHAWFNDISCDTVVRSSPQ
jgi:hypothetical protein